MDHHGYIVRFIPHALRGILYEAYGAEWQRKVRAEFSDIERARHDKALLEPYNASYGATGLVGRFLTKNISSVSSMFTMPPDAKFIKGQDKMDVLAAGTPQKNVTLLCSHFVAHTLKLSLAALEAQLQTDLGPRIEAAVKAGKLEKYDDEILLPIFAKDASLHVVLMIPTSLNVPI